jgi:glutamate-1-semialdehyde 2,1-aminomutase
MAMFCGHANPAIVAAVQAQVARSTQFLLPTEASVEVAEELARRYPVGQWQFTLSATQANTEAIRLARSVTGREVIVLFQGHYHGHFEEGLVDLAAGQPGPVQPGLSKASPAACGSPSSTTPVRWPRRSNPATSPWC